MEDISVNEFIDKLASSAPVPGGGSASAICGALGAALTEMVANLTKGKKKYIEAEEEMKKIIETTSVLRNKLLDYIKKDSDAYLKVIEAYKIPKESKELRDEIIEESLKMASEIPFEIAKTAYDIMPLCEAVVDRGYTNAMTDGLISCMLTKTSILSALYNVKINLASIKDENFTKNMKAKVKELELKAIEYEKKILEKSPY